MVYSRAELDDHSLYSGCLSRSCSNKHTHLSKTARKPRSRDRWGYLTFENLCRMVRDTWETGSMIACTGKVIISQEPVHHNKYLENFYLVKYGAKFEKITL